MLINTSPIHTKIKNISNKIFNILENNGNCEFKSNGEKLFIERLLNLYCKDHKIVTIFDIGANIGAYSITIKDKSKSKSLDTYMHLFEPTNRCFEELSSKFQNIDNMVLNNYGVSDEKKISTIFYDKETSGLASLYKRNLDSYNINLDQSEEINLVRLDDYIKERKINHIHLIKMDIEGHELNALFGLGDYLDGKFIDFIQFEYGGANLDSRTSLMDLYKILEEKDFSIAKIMPRGLEIRNYSPYMENFQYANYVAISNSIKDDLLYI